MPKPLSQMTLEELWSLFPIKLTEHSGEWKKQYEEMADILRGALLSRKIIRILRTAGYIQRAIWNICLSIRKNCCLNFILTILCLQKKS